MNFSRFDNFNVLQSFSPYLFIFAGFFCGSLFLFFCAFWIFHFFVATPAEQKQRGSKMNKKGSAAGKGGPAIKFDKTTLDGLKKKVRKIFLQKVVRLCTFVFVYFS